MATFEKGIYTLIRGQLLEVVVQKKNTKLSLMIVIQILILMLKKKKMIF